MKHDRVYAEIYKAYGFTLYTKMSILYAPGIIYTIDQFPKYPTFLECCTIHPNRIDMEHLSSIVSDGDLANEDANLSHKIIINVADVVSSLEKALPNTKSFVAVHRQVAQMCALHPHLFRNFGFVYNQRLGGFVRIKITTPKIKPKPLYNGTIFNQMRTIILVAGLNHIKKQFGIDALTITRRITTNTVKHANNTALFVKSFVKTPNDLTFYTKQSSNAPTPTKLDFGGMIAFHINHTKTTNTNTAEAVQKLKTDLEAWWEGVTTVK